MLRERTRSYSRIFLAVFTGSLALLLAVWSYSSFAAASLTVSPNVARQNDTVTIRGGGFQPGETISLWITYPDFRVFGVAEVTANGDGSFNYPYLPDFLGASFTPTGKYTYTAFGQNSGRQVFADLQVNIGVAPGTSTGVTLKAQPGRDEQGSFFAFEGRGFGTEEGVALWLRYPDNHVEDLGHTTSGPGGGIYHLLYVEGASIGRYALTAYGLRSGRIGIAEYTLTVSDLTYATGVANLRVSPSPDSQITYALFEGWGFKPGETVSIWVTLPDYSTRTVGDVVANASGAFVADLYLSEQEPVGKRTYTAYGNDSGLRAIASYTLTPGNDVPYAEWIPDHICDGEGCRP